MDSIASLVHGLARRRQILAAMQDDVERIIGRCEALEIEIEALENKIETAALGGDDPMPHPAVIVLRPVPYMTIPCKSHVRIDADLSEYLEKVE